MLKMFLLFSKKENNKMQSFEDIYKKWKECSDPKKVLYEKFQNNKKLAHVIAATCRDKYRHVVKINSDQSLKYTEYSTDPAKNEIEADAVLFGTIRKVNSENSDILFEWTWNASFDYKKLCEIAQYLELEIIKPGETYPIQKITELLMISIALGADRLAPMFIPTEESRKMYLCFNTKILIN